jgi:GT2 family glycosyltransferase
MFTDIDYIFAPNFLKVVSKQVTKGRMLLCQTHDSKSKEDFSEYSHEQFDDILSRCKPHKLCGVGACQLSTTEWFKSIGGYDERMVKWGVMDNDMVRRAQRDGLRFHWLQKRTKIIHQWHRSRKDSTQCRARSVKIYRTDKSVKRNGKSYGKMHIDLKYDYRDDLDTAT